MRKLLLIGAGTIILIGSGLWVLQATPAPQGKGPPPSDPAIPAPSVNPNLVTVNTPATLTATVSITDPTLNPSSVELLRVNVDGSTSVVASMRDDGRGGDQKPGDKNFTATLTIDEHVAGQIQLEVLAAFKGFLEPRLSSTIAVDVWNSTTTLFGTVPYPATWILEPLSNTPSDGIYLTDGLEDESGHGISVALINKPLSSILVDPTHVLITQASQTINGRQWIFVSAEEPVSGLRFYHAFTQIAAGVVVIGGNDSPTNKSIVDTIVSLMFR